MANTDRYDIELWRYPGKSEHIVLQNLTWQQLDYVYDKWMEADMKNDCYYTVAGNDLLEIVSKDNEVRVITFEEFANSH